MVKNESKKDETTKNLKRYKDAGYGQSESDVDKATVWKATYNGKEGLFDLEVYPLKLIDKNANGWEYRIIETEPNGEPKEDGIDFDSFYEISGGYDSAPNVKVAMKWAEATLKDILEERKSKN